MSFPVRLKSRHRRGFTLVELLVSLALLSIMGVVLAECFTQAATVVSYGRAYGDIYRSGQVVMRRLARDVSGIKTEGGYLFLGLTAFDTNGDNVVEELRGELVNYGDTGVVTLPGFLVKGLPMNELAPGSSVLVFYAATSDLHAGGTVFYALMKNGDLIRGVDSVNRHASTIDFRDSILVPNPPGPPTPLRDAYILATNVLSFRAHYLPRYDRDDNGVLGNEGDWVAAWHPSPGSVNWVTYYPGVVNYIPGSPPAVDPDAFTVAPRAVRADLVITNDRHTLKEENTGDDGVSFQTIAWVPPAP